MHKFQNGPAILLGAVLLLFSITSLSQPREVLTKTVTKISPARAEKIIGLSLDEPERNHRYSGTYHYYLDSLNKKILNGPFHLSYQRVTPESNYEPESKCKVIIRGNYSEGHLTGKLEKYSLYDDGIDISWEFTTTLFFDSLTHKCIWASFNGRIGDIMPPSKYEEQNPKEVSFQYMVEVANRQWEKEFKAHPEKYH